MANAGLDILVLNSGSSSLKFALFEDGQRKLSGSISAIGTAHAQLSVSGMDGKRPVQTPDHAAASKVLFATLREHQGDFNFRAVGHRLVHGGPNHFEPERVSDALLADLRKTVIFAPEHLPQAIALIEAVSKQLPSVPQFACFDTAFHKDLPLVARTLPFPRKLQQIGVRRYGFHGLSYQFLLTELRRIGRAGEADGKVVLAHLGNGASLAAVHRGQPVDTTMGMTPAGGLVMGTRTGDIDPGLVSFLERHEHLTPEAFHRMVNHESGMLGISGSTSDMQQLGKQRESDPRAGEAIDVFCYSARKWIGALAAALGGLDTLVFSGGIGEHDAAARRQICESLGFLGVELDLTQNSQNAAIISDERSATVVRVIPTDEEATIYRAVVTLLTGNGVEP